MVVSSDKPIAYFCAEFGLQADLPLYAGGLGILAGDTIKQAADEHFPMVGIGLLYRGGNAIQGVDDSGWQYERDMEIDPVRSGFEHVYIPNEDQPLFVKIHLTKQDVWARVWKKTVGETTLYLLDTDTDQNEPTERGIAKALYDGSEEVLVKQQMVLGIGGVKLLNALSIHPSLYHVNEGRPAFLYWQLIRRFMDNNGMSYGEASAAAKKMIVYTNHTLVKAGNATYSSAIIREYGLYYAEKMGVSIDELIKPGFEAETGQFNITQFALNTSSRAASVSQPHFELSKNLWPDYSWVNVTNGVHLPTWQDPRIRDAGNDDRLLWHEHTQRKRELMEFVQQRTGFGYDSNRLVISWARRMARYKRMNALFDDCQRLRKILSDSSRPVQLLISGRAHARDESAKQQLREMIRMMQEVLSGHALYIPNYDIDVARMLVKGSDVWINTPIQGQEACGTSGMKAIANGVLQLTVEDGWTTEVDWRDVGWTLDNNHVSETFYFRLEEDVVPLYYDRDEQNIPRGWVERMRRSIHIAQQYSAQRMLSQYREKLYVD